MSATTKFKVGDRVRAKAGAVNILDLSIPEGKTGTVADFRWGNHSVEWEDGSGNNALEPQHLELATTTEDEKVEAALAQTKEDLELCEEFDQAVERARNMTFVERLDHVAISMRRGDVFAHFCEILSKPEYVIPELPKTGDYVRVTYVDGTTHESEVESIGAPGESCRFYNIHFREGRWTVVPVDTEAYKRYSKDEPHNIVIKVEQIERPVEIPEIGKWIEAQYKEGHTDTFEVDQAKDNGAGNIFLNVDPNKGFIQTRGKGNTRPERIITSWKYVAPPKEEVKPVEIDGYWIVRNREGRVVAYLTERDAEQGSRPQNGADTVEEAEANIADWASRSYLRRYIPLALAIIKFLERNDNEED